MALINHKKITIFAGHYGSGKTNLAVNYALWLRKLHSHVMVCDLDIVNPYFRTKDSEAVLTENGIRLAAPIFANSNLDIPAIPPETAVAFQNNEVYSVFDVGGDDSGAVALGQFAPRILKSDYELLMVINKYRPETRDPQGAIELMHEMQSASGIKFTAIVNNSNLGESTTKKNLMDSRDYAEKVSALANIPLKMHCLREDLTGAEEDDIFKIKIYGKKNWQISNKEQEGIYGKGRV